MPKYPPIDDHFSNCYNLFFRSKILARIFFALALTVIKTGFNANRNMRVDIRLPCFKRFLVNLQFFNNCADRSMKIVDDFSHTEHRTKIAISMLNSFCRRPQNKIILLLPKVLFTINNFSLCFLSISGFSIRLLKFSIIKINET